ncbi:hypothetical protein [Neobacillus drentensis]|nr:hypothetical protein [Neobacillus drentensis]
MLSSNDYMDSSKERKEETKHVTLHVTKKDNLIVHGKLARRFSCGYSR